MCYNVLLHLREQRFCLLIYKIVAIFSTYPSQMKSLDNLEDFALKRANGPASFSSELSADTKKCKLFPA